MNVVNEKKITQCLNDLCKLPSGLQGPIDTHILNNLYNERHYSRIIDIVSHHFDENVDVSVCNLHDTKSSNDLVWVSEDWRGIEKYTSKNCSKHTRIIIYIRGDLLEDKPFIVFLSILAREVSHIVLFLQGHNLSEMDKLADLYAMVCGFAEVIVESKKKMIAKVPCHESIFTHFCQKFYKQIPEPCHKYGYLNEEEAQFAFERICALR